MKRLILFFTLLSPALWAQRGNVEDLSLPDLSAFQPQAGNWKIVGEVIMDPSIDIHEKPAPPPVVDTGKKRKKKGDTAPPPPPLPPAVVFKPGTGILLNMNDEARKDNLLTKWEHGDIILETEVMLPKGSNSGIYLQGRYEVQLLDSWGVQTPSFSDIGGIYRNWESTPGQIYMGKAPLTNAAKAPGLWQHLKIAFRAPRFDAAGNKTADARFVYVELNGLRIHENVAVPMPTGGPISKEETPLGPIMIQGDHGPVAFRHIKVQHLLEKEITLTGLRYDLYQGDFQAAAELAGLTPASSGPLSQLTAQITDEQENFGIVYHGTLNAPEAGRYDLRLNYDGGAQVIIGKQQFDGSYRGNGEIDMAVELRAGSNDFQLTYFKNTPWWSSRLGLFNVGSFPVPLHTIDSYPPRAGQASPINVTVGNRPRLLRAFLDFAGDRRQRLTHTIGVGGTQGIHYIYDLKTGSIACVWRGDFIDATPMWNSRGDGSFRPKGATQYLFTGLSLARLNTPEAPFPKQLDESSGFQNKGYSIDETTGLPVFLYRLDSLEIIDFLAPDPSGKAFSRTISLKNAGDTAGLFYKLAEGRQILELPNGNFVVDQQYYIQPAAGITARIREKDGREELIAPLEATGMTYTINW